MEHQIEFQKCRETALLINMSAGFPYKQIIQIQYLGALVSINGDMIIIQAKGFMSSLIEWVHNIIFLILRCLYLKYYVSCRFSSRPLVVKLPNGKKETELKFLSNLQ